MMWGSGAARTLTMRGVARLLHQLHQPLAVARGLSAVDGYQMHRRRALCCALDVEWVARLRTLCLRFVRSRAVMAKRKRTRYASDVVRGVPCRWRGGCAGVKRSVRQ